MIESIRLGRNDSLYQVAIAVGRKRDFMCPIFEADCIAPNLRSKIEEQRALAPVLRKRHVTRLLVTVPHDILYCAVGREYARAEACRTRDGQAVIVADATVVSAVEELLRRSELAAGELHLPRRLRKERRFILVVGGGSHIHDNGIAVRQHSPARDGGAFHVKLNKPAAGSVDVPHIDRGICFHTL